MDWLVIIAAIFAAAAAIGAILYFIMSRLVRWMDEIEQSNQDKEIE